MSIQICTLRKQNNQPLENKRKKQNQRNTGGEITEVKLKLDTETKSTEEKKLLLDNNLLFEAKPN